MNLYLLTDSLTFLLFGNVNKNHPGISFDVPGPEPVPKVV